MADNWDLHAVVRGCASANSPGNNPTEEALPDFDSLTFGNDDSGPFCYSGFDEQNMNLKSHLGLEEVYLSFNSQTQPISPQFNDSTAGAGAPLTSQHFHSPPVRSRRRKNELQPKVVREMRQEDLMGDLWAWRKYGQKPIKGSPYPRNYYRCSTSKGCSARKQVEKSPTDPNIFVVCYSGDHTHPRPTHRNALAGGTRNRFSTSVESSEAQSSTATDAPNPPCSSLSPSLSPTTEGESVNSHGNDDVEMEGEDDILIPNPIISEDILKGFEELWGGFYRSSDLDSRGGAAGGEFSAEGGDQ